MRRVYSGCLVGLLLILAVSLPGYCHVPGFPTGNDEIDSATVIDDPAKSVVIYSELESGGEAEYYRSPLSAGERLRVTLIASTRSYSRGFRPRMALLVPKTGLGDAVPGQMEVPEGYSVVESTPLKGDAVYEGFSPSAFHRLFTLNQEQSTGGDYYIVVYGNSGGGSYGLVVGYVESYSIWEWLRLPLDLVSIWRWEGQGLLAIFAPFLLVVALGFPLILRRISPRTRRGFLSILTSLGGLLIAGSGCMTLYQMVYALSEAGLSAEVVITGVIASAQLAIGTVLLRTGLSPRGADAVPRLRVLMLGLLGLLAWAGFFIGPALALISGLVDR